MYKAHTPPEIARSHKEKEELLTGIVWRWDTEQGSRILLFTQQLETQQFALAHSL